LLSGQTALDCAYCGEQQKQAQATPFIETAQSTAPPKTNVLWYVAIWLVCGALAVITSNSKGRLFDILIDIVTAFFLISILSLLWYGLRRSIWWLKNRS
jgi:uncharacterized membrane protein YeaQ/YmgE (transglycosylase-associated protein family)